MKAAMESVKLSPLKQNIKVSLLAINAKAHNKL